ncbi:hypothetical protein BJ170DRAFT_733029 [Xylariales sp. AK1849]|nr:hypothetical protein BJ170DRAFT_733029 [Xylariales sp. AK1849]
MSTTLIVTSPVGGAPTTQIGVIVTSTVLTGATPVDITQVVIYPSPLTVNGVTVLPVTTSTVSASKAFSDTTASSTSESSSIVSSSSPTSNTARSSSNTAVSSAATTIPPTSSQSSLTGVSSDAAAGIAVACALLGLVIGAIASFLILRRRQRRKPEPEYVPVEYGGGREKDVSSGAHPPVSGAPLDQYLLDPKPDAEVVGELRDLGTLIQQHVDGNYHLRPVHQNSTALTQTLISLGIPRAGTVPASHLASLALDPRTRYAALQHVIGRVTFDSTVLFGSSAISLLPTFVAAFTRAVAPIEQHRGSSEAFATALAKWRQLSAFLLHPSRSDGTALVPSEYMGTQQAQQLTAALNKFLEPFTNAGDLDSRYEQENHLREVIVECANFGYLLFSQPSDFKFRFDGDGKHSGLVTSPGLDKLTDVEGRRHSSPQRLTAPVVESI